MYVYFEISDRKHSYEILGQVKWAKISLWNDDGTYSAADPLQWLKVSIFGIFRTLLTWFDLIHFEFKMVDGYLFFVKKIWLIKELGKTENWWKMFGFELYFPVALKGC